jgi:hypothetical protein|tara:strand:+ start:6301 stop:6417 length:117 start_codon:yes stop_codon:yes gene_type:complete
MIDIDHAGPWQTAKAHAYWFHAPQEALHVFIDKLTQGN